MSAKKAEAVEAVEVTEGQAPEFMTKETTRALIKIKEASGSDADDMATQLALHITLFTCVLKGLIGDDGGKEALALVADSTAPMHVMSEAEAAKKTVH